MSYLLPHLRSGWHVDQAILTEEERVVVLRFGRDADETCMRMDEVRRLIFSRRRAHGPRPTLQTRLTAPPSPPPPRRPSPAWRTR